MFVWRFVHAIEPWHACGGHRTNFGSQFSPSTSGSRHWTQVVMLCGSGFYPLSHLTGLNCILRKESTFGETDVLYVVKTEPESILLSEWWMHRASFLFLKPRSSLSSLSFAGGVILFCSHTSPHTQCPLQVHLPLLTLVVLLPEGYVYYPLLSSHTTHLLEQQHPFLQNLAFASILVGCQQWNNFSALQQSPFAAAGKWELTWAMASVSQHVLVLARRPPPDYTGC